mgnify:CR=1 FL=1
MNSGREWPAGADLMALLVVMREGTKNRGFLIDQTSLLRQLLSFIRCAHFMIPEHQRNFR